MFIGRYYHTLEEKGRVSLPKAFRPDSHTTWVITRGLDGGLFLFTPTEFAGRLAELASRTFTQKRDRDFVRYMVNDAVEVEVDSQGRVLVPEYLREFAHITKQVVVIGSYDHLEMWDVARYHDYLTYLEEKGEELAESITPTSHAG